MNCTVRRDSTGLNKMEQAYRTRLDMLGKRLKDHLDAYTELTKTGATLQNLVELKTRLQQTVARYSADLDSYIKQAENPLSEVIQTCTENQITVDDTLASLEPLIITLSSQDHKKQHSKLPTLPPPRFSGDTLDYHEFWDKFQATIERRELEDVDKLSYLMAAVDGKAKEALSGLAISNANYEIAVNTLRSQFGNKGAQIDAHYEALKLLPTATSKANCRKTLNAIEHHLRVLETFGEDIDGNHLRTTIMNKFPSLVLYELNMALPDERTVPQIRRTLDKIVKAYEKSNPGDFITPSIPLSTETSTTQALLQATSHKRGMNEGRGKPVKRKFQEEPRKATNYNKKPKRSCIYCSESSHYSSECQKVKTVIQRKGLLKGRCFICLRTGHTSDSCQSKKPCYHCRGKHHQSLCPKRGDESKLCNISITSDTEVHLNNVTSFLQTATVKLQNNKIERPCRLLLDSGSQRSYITSRMAKEMKIVAGDEDLLMIYTFGSNQPKKTSSPSADINIITKRDIHRNIHVNIVANITERVQVPQITPNPRLDVIADDSTAGERIDLLIGNDYFQSFMRTEVIKIKDYLFLVDTEFGWIITGKIDNTNDKQDILSVVTYCQCQEPERLYFTEPDLPLREIDVKFLWTLESIGITDSAKTNRQEEAVKLFTDTVQYEDGRYQVKWPWTEYPPDLSSNFGLAYGRLKGLIRRLDRNTLEEYRAILQEQLDAKIIEVIDSQPAAATTPVHYLPHHIVKHEGKKGRIVYDASARVKDQRSLNECMYKGPSMLEDMTKLLIKFRTGKVGITADVEKAFLQIGIQESDRDVTRFLWLKDIEKDASEDNIMHLRFCRVPFGIISSPFLLTATIRHHLSKKNHELVSKIADRCYVDNLVTTASSSSAAYKLYEETRTVFDEIAMNIRDWSSNDPDFIAQIKENHRATQDKTVKVLGLSWNLEDDSLQLKLNDKVFDEESAKRTKNKRDVLKILASFYDPCGFASPIVLPAKILLQRLWKSKHKWDTPLSEDVKNEWKLVVENLRTAKDVRIARYVGNDEKSECQLHCFTDASKDAHAAVVYLRVTSQQSTKTVFIMSKSRVNPLAEKENLKIPRLELLGYVIGSRLLSYVKSALDIAISKQFLWTDSLVVLSWMKSSKLLPPFVTRRVNEIKQQNPDTEMCYINTEQNPADLATRPELWAKKNQLWLQGPKFLQQNESRWPVNMKLEHHQSALSAVVEGLDSLDIESPETSNHDVVTEVQTEQVETNEQNTSLNTETAELKKLQAKYFTEEILGKETHLSRNLGLFLDVDGILRCKGRVTHTDWSYEMKHPILLPKDCEFTSKVILEAHEKNYHVGTSHTLSIVRQKYWIPQGRSQVQKILKKCPRCVKHGGGPYTLPPTPDLPPERVTFRPAFTYTGVDYFGPMYVTTGQNQEKRWICLYTCLVVRAIHLEVVRNLTAEECLLSLRRFIASRGKPSLITSDNALQFRLTSEVLIDKYCKENSIRWKFIPQLAPWHGGVYERMVAVVKHCLKRTLEKHLLGDSQLLTIIKEVETVCNSRPLTYVSVEPEHVLRPVDFLSLGKCLTINSPPNEDIPESSITKQVLIEGWKRGQRILSEFKSMFIGQYLVSLRERYRHSHKQPRIKSDKTPKIGDVVQIKGDSKNRDDWRVGKISSLVMSPDSECRIAKVKVGDSEFTRSIGHLYPLESEIVNSVEDLESQPPAMPTILTRHRENETPHRMQNDEDNAETTNRSVTEESETSEREIPETSQATNLEFPIQMDVDGEEADPNTITQDSEPDSSNNLTEFSDNTEVRSRRAAAIRAREKIAEWTRLLFTLLK